MQKVNQDILGEGLRFPMVRTGSDFQVSSGEDLVMSTVPYILETQANSPDIQGEIPWDSEFGTQIARLKHKNIVTDNEALNELARHYVIDGLVINEPRLIVREVWAEQVFESQKNNLDIHMTLGLIDEDISANDVRIQNDALLSVRMPI